MNMREIKAFVHRNRIADVVSALASAGFRNLSVIDVQGLLRALDSKEQQYSVEIGQKVVTQVKLELVCETKADTQKAVALIREHAVTGQPDAGWIYISKIQSRIEIPDSVVT
jgi:nitrogen regulatory protein P-II 1